MTENLLELNPDVKGDYIHQDIHEFVSKESDLMKSYQLIIATDVDNVTPLLTKHLESGPCPQQDRREERHRSHHRKAVRVPRLYQKLQTRAGCH